MGGGQNLEQLNVERSIFWNFKIANIKITEDVLFHGFIFEFMFFFFYKLAGGRNIEQSNIERLIFQHSKIANVKSKGRSSYSIFLFTKLFLIFFII